MAFIGQIDRLGWKYGAQAMPAGLFVFDDALVFVRLGVGLSFGLGMRPGKAAREEVKKLCDQDGLTPEQVMSHPWPKALNIATADIVRAELGPSLQGALVGVMSLQIRVKEGRIHEFMAASAAKGPLRQTLTSVLGDRFVPD